ncbi:hypothetical protein LSAT2_009133 [Lamellibrachia satsuma]|nr:hypothetical protein LSAT2_009133 [Lamellibrachia satsuma]
MKRSHNTQTLRHSCYAGSSEVDVTALQRCWFCGKSAGAHIQDKRTTQAYKTIIQHKPLHRRCGLMQTVHECITHSAAGFVADGAHRVTMNATATRTGASERDVPV